MATTKYSDEGCCGETQPYNPKTDRPRRSGKLKLFDLQNPIPGEVEDSQELKKFFSAWDLVPYAGSVKESGHTLLIWYIALSKMSNTHGACISKLNKYAFGGRAIFTASQDPEYEISQTDVRQVSPTESQAFYEALKDAVTFDGGVRDFHRRIGYWLKVTGNSFVELSFSQTLGANKFFLKAHKTLHCLYKNTKPGEAKVVYVSPIWRDDYLREKPARGVPLYPNFVRMADGTLRTMFHLKNGQNDWYGRPDTEFADLQKVQEAQHAIYLVKQANANFMGQLIIEVEDDDPDKDPALDDSESQARGFDNFAQEFEQNYTMKSDDPQAVLLTARPFGSRPMFVFQVKPNTNENWYKVTGDDAADRIMRAHNCTRRFMGFEVASGLSGADSFLTDYIMNMEPIINEYRNEVTIFTNGILTAIWDLNATPQFNQTSITFASPIRSAVEDYRTRQTAQANNGTDPTNNSLRGNQVQSSGT